MTTIVRPEQLANALSPIDVTDGGMTTLVRPEQSKNALPPIDVTDDGMSTDVLAPGQLCNKLPSFE